VPNGAGNRVYGWVSTRNAASWAFAASAFAGDAGFGEGAADIAVLVGFPPLAA